jgi:pimeloyl-ACP methyl ester carboxylesterase
MPSEKTSQKSHRIAALCLSLTLGLLIFSLSLPGFVRASGPKDGSGRENGAVIGLASSALECLAVGDDLPGKASGVVKLTWQGQAKRARLVLSVAGAEAAHTIEVNGQPAALAPMHPGGQPCSAEEYFYLDISPEVLGQGDNLIEMTDDALPGDSWTAANVRLEVFGEFAVSQAGGADSTGQIGTADVSYISRPIFTFTNSYDGSSQEAMAQVPDGYDDNTPTPLLIAVHARGGTKEKGLDWFDEEADNRGWLLASPEMHGSWPIPPECFVYPNDCDYEDKVLAGTTSPTADPRPGAYAYASLEGQYDVIGTVNYMVQSYNVDPDRIYLVGYSMGGQGAAIIAAKFPHLFAAVFDNKGPTDMVEWYDEQVAYYGTPNADAVRAMRKECYVVEGSTNTPAYPSSGLGTPANPFCYQRRSGIHFASNYLHIPISMTHSISDTLVPIHHSRDLRDAINSYGPDQPAFLFEDTVIGPTCPPPKYHCYEPDPAAVFNFLEPFTLNNNPTHINITTDESKSYYWMNLAQTGGDHWSQIEVTYYPVSSTVAATISDTNPLTVAFNLGSTPIMGIIEQPGMGLPATTYLVKGGGNSYLHNYTSGYLTTTLTTTGQFTLTISANATNIYLPIVIKNY